MISTKSVVAAVLLSIVSNAYARGHEEVETMEMKKMNMTIDKHSNINMYWMPSYIGLSSYSSSILAHIILMIAAWVFILPIAVMFSISRSRFALPIQLLFLVLNGLGVLMGTIYNIKTPDLYENNAHHTIGWIAIWIMTVQAAMTFMFLYSGRSTQRHALTNERASFLPMLSHHTNHPSPRPYNVYRWSGDSGQGTECSSTHESRDISPTDPNRISESENIDLDDDEDDKASQTSLQPQTRFWRTNFIDRYLSQSIPSLFSNRLLKIVEVLHLVIDKTILILSFIALLTGGVTYTGIFRGANIMNGLAHFIKGGIFFWYGLLTLGRWMGCFADVGWAWNLKPTRSQVGQLKASFPSAEFVESFVIFLYGCSNVFLEHLAAWGGPWNAQDFEHVSISIMFFGGGMCGMLVESKSVRRMLNTSIDLMPRSIDVHPDEAEGLKHRPKSYRVSMNPFPALIIMLLGIIMSSHHQESMVSTVVHKQWGTLLVGFSLARGVTYIITYLSPPTSEFPSRPPSELVSAFCLISGGLIFMASTKDIIHYMEEYNLMAMFLFTVMMGLAAFLMSYEIAVLALKGWAVRNEAKRVATSPKY